MDAQVSMIKIYTMYSCKNSAHFKSTGLRCDLKFIELLSNFITVLLKNILLHRVIILYYECLYPMISHLSLLVLDLNLWSTLRNFVIGYVTSRCCIQSHAHTGCTCCTYYLSYLLYLYRLYHMPVLIPNYQNYTDAGLRLG